MICTGKNLHENLSSLKLIVEDISKAIFVYLLDHANVNTMYTVIFEEFVHLTLDKLKIEII